MTRVATHRRGLLSRFLESAVAVVATLVTALACARLAPGASPAARTVVAGLAATVLVFVIDRLMTPRLPWNAAQAASTLRQCAPCHRQLPLERVLAASTTIAVIVDEAGRVAYANPSAQSFFAAVPGAAGSLEGASLPALLAAGPCELREAALATHDVLFTSEQQGAAEPETYHLARHDFVLAARRHTLFLLRPLTRELARQEVETWKKAIRALSREVNDSLAPITSLVHSARLMLANPPGFRQRLGAALDTIEERSAHLKAVLDGYASFARLPLPSRRAVPWRELLAGVEALYRFRQEGPLPEAPAFVDPGQLQQALLNLLKNAAESGSAPEDITLAVRAHGGGVEIVVSDRGKGIPPEVMRNALLPFCSTKKTGGGLGLAVCREIVEAHGGRLSLHPREGGGVTVRCWLPAA